MAKTFYILEFGNRGGRHTDNFVFKTFTDAQRMAAALVGVFANRFAIDGGAIADWSFNPYSGKELKRLYWVSETHFVVLTKQDGTVKGSGKSGELWRRDSKNLQILNSVLPDYNA